jgi:hypothetical protein
MESSSIDIKEAYCYHEMLDELARGVDDYWESSESDESDEFDEWAEEFNEEAEELEKAEETEETAETEESEYEQPSFPLFIRRLEDDLTLPDNSCGYHCSNSKVRPYLWMDDLNVNLKNHNMRFLAQLGQLCVQAKIRECTNEACRKKKERMNIAAPACSWKSF